MMVVRVGLVLFKGHYMKLFFTHLFCAGVFLILSWAGWWYTYDMPIVKQYALGDIWLYWDKFNYAWAFASAFGSAYFLLLAVSKKDQGKK